MNKTGVMKLIPSILGVLLLVGAVVTGVSLTRQNQNLEESAYTVGQVCHPELGVTGGCDPGLGCSCKTNGCFCAATGGQNPCYHTICPINYVCSGTGMTAFCVLSSPTAIPTSPPSTSTPTPLSTNTPTPLPTNTPTPLPTSTPTPLPTNTPTPLPTNTSTPTPLPTSTPTPLPYAMCQYIGAYSLTWTPMSLVQLSTTKAGDQFYYCVVGAVNYGIIDMARFTINNVLFPNTTLKRPGGVANEFCQQYTVPVSTYSFNVIGEVHSSVLGWVR